MRARQTQRDKILTLLQSRANGWVALYEILPLAAQYSARVCELRKMGHCIENKVAHHDGQVRSWFRLVLPKAQEKLFADQPETERPRTREHWLEAQPQRSL